MSAKTSLHLLIGLLVCVGILVPISGSAQSNYRVNIDYVDVERFPAVSAYVTVADSQGYFVHNLLDTTFVVSEDGLPVPAFTLREVQNLQQPLAIVLVMDSSSGMNQLPRPTALQQAIDAAKGFIQLLESQDQVAVLAYSDTAALICPFASDVAAVAACLDDLPRGTKAAMFDGLLTAVDSLRDRTERRVIILVSNGKDTRSRSTVDQVVAAANEAAVSIYPIGIGNEVNLDQLRELANGTGGRTFPQPSPNALKAAFNSILQAVREQYLFEYSSALKADQQNHMLKVQATIQGSQYESSLEFVAKAGKLIVSLGFENGQTVGGDVNIEPTVTASADLQRMAIALDGTPLATITAPDPMKYTWDSTKSEMGQHDLTVTMTDKAGNSGMAAARLDVQPAVTVKITRPSEGATVSGLTEIKAEATTPSGKPASSVQFVVKGEREPPAPLAAPPFVRTWDASLSPPGKQTIQVTAYDSEGHRGEAEITVNVAPPPIPWATLAIGIVVLGAIVVSLAAQSRKRRVSSAPVPTRSSTGALQLHELAGESPNHIWPLGTNEIRLGRKRDENDIPLAGSAASRHHAVIRFEQGQHVIVGLKADNPVVINGHSTTQTTVLQAGDTIELGESKFQVQRS